MGRAFSILFTLWGALSHPSALAGTDIGDFQPLIKAPPLRGLEMRVLRTQVGRVKTGSGGEETLLPSVDLGFRFIKGVTLNPRVVAALVPGPGGVQAPVSLTQGRFEATWVISSLPRDISIRLVDNKGTIVERLEFRLEAPPHGVHSSPACKQVGLQWDVQGHKPPGSLLLLCSPDTVYATVLALGAKTIGLSPTLHTDRMLGTQGAHVDLERPDTIVVADYEDQRQEYRIVSRWHNEGASALTRNVHLEGRLGVSSFNARQTDLSAGPADLNAARSLSGFAPAIAGAFIYQENGGMVELRVDTMLAPLSLSSGTGHYGFYRLTPSLVLWPLRKSQRWSIGLGMGMKQEWHLIDSWAHRDVTVALQPELMLKVRRHFSASTSALTYSAGFAPSRFPGSTGFGDRYILLQELAYTHRTESSSTWGFWLDYSIFRHLKDQLATRNDSISLGLSLGW